MRSLALLLLVTGSLLQAQRTPSVRASGEGVVAAMPELVRINLTISTPANTAQEATDQNATTSLAVSNRVKALIGTSGEIRTVSYSVTPNYRTTPPNIIGFTANNTLEVTAYDLNLAGKIVDAAVQAGATSVGGLRFGLKDSDPQRRDALKRATQVARANATAIAEGLSVRLGSILSAAEGSTVSIFNPTDARAGIAATATTFDTGLVEVRATVTLEIAIIQ